jgi:hypothetical protein
MEEMIVLTTGRRMNRGISHFNEPRKMSVPVKNGTLADTRETSKDLVGPLHTQS